jgi:hypothetical protein
MQKEQLSIGKDSVAVLGLPLPKKEPETLPEAQRNYSFVCITWVISPGTKHANSAERKNQVKDSIGSNFGHQMAPIALFANLATRWRHLYY